MKKILIGLGGLVAVLLAAILIVPGFIDWNDYKAEITRRAKEATGRDIVIDGDIKLTVLPAPALNVANVRLANIKGAATPDMVRLKSLQVRIALGPLLGGRIQVQTVRLLEPVIELERLADGRVNWSLGGAEKQTGGKPAPDDDNFTAGAGAGTEKDTQTATPDIVLDSFVIENGTVVYRDAKAGTVERVENINADIAAASISGPFESDGAFSLGGIPVNYDVTVGKIIEGRTAPVRLALGIAPGATRLAVSGIVVGIDGTPKFKGKVTLKGDKLSGLARELAPSGELPGLLGQAFELSADITAGATGAEFANLSVGLGTVTATGDAAIELGKAVNVSLNLAADSIDADGWLALPGVASPVAAPAAAAAPAGQPATAAADKAAVKKAVPDAGFALPGGVNASLRLSAKTISLKGGLVRDARFDAELANGEITISQMSAQLPGSADVAVFGFVAPLDGTPQFDGELEVSIDNLRGILGWLDIAPPPVPTDRLRKLTLTAMLTATPAEARLGKIDLQFDSSRLTGSVRAGLTGTKAVSADLVLDRINMDAYLGPAKAPESAAARTAPPTSISASRAGGQVRAGGGPLAALSALGALKTVDARLKARIKTLVYKGAPIKEIVIDGKVADNTLTMNTLSVARMAGAKIKAGGVVSSLVGVPALKNVSLDVTTGDVARLFRMAGIEAPMDSRKMGVVSLRARADGSLLRPFIDATVKGAGGSLRATGKVSLLPVFDAFDGRLTIKHKNMAALVRALGVNYRPAGKLGPVDFSTALKARASGAALSDIRARIGPVNMTGTANVALDGPRVKLTAALKTGEVVIDKFLPASGRASLSRPGGFLPAAFTADRSARLADPAFRRMAALSSGRWSTAPLDFSVLKAFDADLKLQSDALVYGNYRIAGTDLAATVNGGVLQIERFNGGLFGGTIAARGTVTAANPSRFDTSLSLQGLNVANALAAVTGKSPASGNGAMELRLSSAGYTPSDMIAALSGNGSITMKKLDVKSGAAGTPMAAAFGLISGLNDLGGLLSGRKAGSRLADINGTFTIDRGVVRFSDLALNSGMGSGRASGSADLARWMVDVNGEVVLSQGFLGQILNNGKQTTQRLPFRVSGRLDSPNVKLDTSKLQSAGLPIPGLDKALGKSKVGRVLQQIIPGFGGTSRQPPPSPQPPSPGDTPPPPPPAGQSPQKLKPEDLLKGLFRGFGR